MAKMEVTASSGLKVRKGPGTSNSTVRVLPKGTIVNTTESKNGWYKHDKGGWSSGSYLKAVPTPAAPPPVAPSPNKPEPAPVKPLPAPAPPPFKGTYVGVVPLKELKTVLNMPYQYRAIVDARVKDSYYGRNFSEKIVADAPIVTFKVGVPKFLGTNVKETQENALKSILAGTPSILQQIIGDANRDMRYYTFDEAHTAYMGFVNTMCRQAAANMQLGKEFYLKDFDYEMRASTSDIFQLGKSRSVSFYMDINSSFSETPSNNTGESMLAGGLKTVSEVGKEVEFLMGAGLGFSIDLASTEAFNESLGKINRKSNNPNSLFSRIENVVHNLKHGGNLVFPEIWKESSFQKSYTIKIKLVAPYGTKECIFNEIMVPLYHLLAMTLPRSLTPNGYVSPYLVRCYSKGIFNCEMGIVDSIDISRGGNGDQWSVDGLPTEVDVVMSLRDLYPVMSMSQHKYGFLFSANTPLLDYIATMSGVNLNEPDLQRNIDAFIKRITALMNDIKPSIYKRIDDKIYTAMEFFNLNSRYS